MKTDEQKILEAWPESFRGSKKQTETYKKKADIIQGALEAMANTDNPEVRNALAEAIRPLYPSRKKYRASAWSGPLQWVSLATQDSKIAKINPALCWDLIHVFDGYAWATNGVLMLREKVDVSDDIRAYNANALDAVKVKTRPELENINHKRWHEVIDAQAGPLKVTLGLNQFEYFPDVVSWDPKLMMVLRVKLPSGEILPVVFDSDLVLRIFGNADRVRVSFSVTSEPRVYDKPCIRSMQFTHITRDRTAALMCIHPRPWEPILPAPISVVEAHE
jgi:hypothetical protein